MHKHHREPSLSTSLTDLGKQLNNENKKPNTYLPGDELNDNNFKNLSIRSSRRPATSTADQLLAHIVKIAKELDECPHPQNPLAIPTHPLQSRQKKSASSSLSCPATAEAETPSSWMKIELNELQSYPSASWVPFESLSPLDPRSTASSLPLRQPELRSALRAHPPSPASSLWGSFGEEEAIISAEILAGSGYIKAFESRPMVQDQVGLSSQTGGKPQFSKIRGELPRPAPAVSLITERLAELKVNKNGVSAMQGPNEPLPPYGETTPSFQGDYQGDSEVLPPHEYTKSGFQLLSSSDGDDQPPSHMIPGSEDDTKWPERNRNLRRSYIGSSPQPCKPPAQAMKKQRESSEDDCYSYETQRERCTWLDGTFDEARVEYPALPSIARESGLCGPRVGYEEAMPAVYQCTHIRKPWNTGEPTDMMEKEQEDELRKIIVSEFHRRKHPRMLNREAREFFVGLNVE